MKKSFVKNLFKGFNIWMLLLAIIVLLVSVNGALGKEISPSVPYPDYGYGYNYNNMQNSQYYSVLFDGEGEAKVVARYTIFNNNPSNSNQMNLMNGIKIEIPGQDVRILNVFSLDNGLEFLDYKIERLSNSVVLNINFKDPLQSLKSTTLLVSYKSDNYSTKSSGLFGDVFNYKFESAKIEKDMDYTLIGVSVDLGLYLDDVKSNVNYRSNMFDTFSSKAAITASSYESMRGYVGNIGYGQKTKSTSSLDPYESFSINGKYSESQIALHTGRYFGMIIAGLVGLFFVLFGFFRARALSKNQDIVKKSLATGFLFSLGLSVLWGLFFVLMNFANRFYSAWLFVIIIFILMIVLSIIVMIGPCIYLATKYKPICIVWYLASFFGSLIVFAGVFAIVYFMFFYQSRVYYGY